MSFVRQDISQMQQLVHAIAHDRPHVAVQATGMRVPGPGLQRAEQAKAFVQFIAPTMEPWRMSFHGPPGNAFAHLHARPLREVHVIDAKGWSESAVVEHFAQHLAGAPPRLDKNPPGWTSYYLTGPDEHYVVSCGSHIGHDAVTVYLRQQAFFDFVSWPDAGMRGDHRAPAGRPFHEYVQWEQALLQSPERRARLDHWRRTLEGARALAWPGDQGRREPASVGKLGPVRTFPMCEGLSELKAATGCSNFDFVAAALLLTLRRFSGQADILLGFPFSVRSILPEFKRTLGPMVDYLPLRVNTDLCSTGIDLLASVGETKRAAIENYLPVGFLLDQLALPWKGNPTPLLQCLVNVIPSVANGPALLLDRPGDRLSSVSSRASTPLNLVTKGAPTLERQDLTLLAMHYGDELRWRLGVRKDLFEAEVAESLEATYRQVGERLLENPAASVGQLIGL